MNISVPGMDRAVAQDLLAKAHRVSLLERDARQHRCSPVDRCSRARMAEGANSLAVIEEGKASPKLDAIPAKKSGAYLPLREPASAATTPRPMKAPAVR